MHCRPRIPWGPSLLSRGLSSRPKKKDHYDSLEVGSQATQGEIKSAYFKLSMQYHPDKNSSESAKVKFRDIAEAYEVLGNYQKRRQYDRGMQIRTGQEPRRQEEAKKDIKKEAYRARAAIYRQSTDTTGTGRMYDFDEWTREHYGNTFRKTMKMKQDVSRKRGEREEIIAAEPKNAVEFSVLGLAILVFAAALGVITAGQSYDTPIINSEIRQQGERREKDLGGT